MVKRLTGLEALFGANREEHAEQEQIVLAYNLFKQSKTRKDARAIQPLCCDFIDAYEYLPQNLKEDWLDEYKEIIKYMNLELVNAVLTEFGVPKGQRKYGRDLIILFRRAGLPELYTYMFALSAVLAKRDKLGQLAVENWHKISSHLRSDLGLYDDLKTYIRRRRYEKHRMDKLVIEGKAGKTPLQVNFDMVFYKVPTERFCLCSEYEGSRFELPFHPELFGRIYMMHGCTYSDTNRLKGENKHVTHMQIAYRKEDLNFDNHIYYLTCPEEYAESMAKYQEMISKGYNVGELVHYLDVLEGKLSVWEFLARYVAGKDKDDFEKDDLKITIERWRESRKAHLQVLKGVLDGKNMDWFVETFEIAEQNQESMLEVLRAVGARLDKKSLLQRGPAKLRTNLDSLLTEKLIGDRPRALRWVKDNVKKDSAENIGFESLLDMFGIKYDEFKEFSDTVDSLIE